MLLDAEPRLGAFICLTQFRPLIATFVFGGKSGLNLTVDQAMRRRLMSNATVSAATVPTASTPALSRRHQLPRICTFNASDTLTISRNADLVSAEGRFSRSIGSSSASTQAPCTAEDAGTSGSAWFGDALAFLRLSLSGDGQNANDKRQRDKPTET
jgi:hypothetical protein